MDESPKMQVTKECMHSNLRYTKFKVDYTEQSILEYLCR